jgi:hypothetical protein
MVTLHKQPEEQKMSKFEERQYKLHSHYASALIDGDLTAFSDEEEQDFEMLCDWLRDELGGSIHCVDAEDAGFAPYNDYDNLGGDMMIYTFLVYENQG